MNVNDIITPQEDPSGKMAEFAANLKYEDIPAEQADYIKRDIFALRVKNMSRIK